MPLVLDEDGNEVSEEEAVQTLIELGWSEPRARFEMGLHYGHIKSDIVEEGSPEDLWSEEGAEYVDEEEDSA